ncbi:MAG: glycosyltransferase [Planctomycetes bacterium]|jgi:glycosyltransferase involved in cell wall biosynthesis|nr:glycosyltransferase [Planctomycetota bacterium]
MPSTRRPTVTVITPCLNAGRYLERTICSVLDQQTPGVEYIVADGGSRDESVELIRAYEDELTAWRSGPDAGAAAAINWALARASGQWVVILPAGDVLMPGALHALSDAITRQPDVRWFHGHAHCLDEHDQTVGVVSAAANLSLSRWLMHDTDGAATAANAYRRDLLAEVGPFNATLRHAWHYEYHARLLAAKQSPTLIATDLAGQRRETYRLPDAQQTIARGYEQIAAAERFSDRVSSQQRAVLWRNLDERRQIHAIAEAEAAGVEGQKVLWRRLMDRPWWINSDRYRRAITKAASEHLRTEEAAAPLRRAA